MTKRCNHIDHILFYIRAIPLILPYLHQSFNITMCIFSLGLNMMWFSFYWKPEQLSSGRTYRACREKQWCVGVLFWCPWNLQFHRRPSQLVASPVETRRHTIMKKAKGWGKVLLVNFDNHHAMLIWRTLATIWEGFWVVEENTISEWCLRWGGFGWRGGWWCRGRLDSTAWKWSSCCWWKDMCSGGVSVVASGGSITDLPSTLFYTVIGIHICVGGASVVHTNDGYIAKRLGSAAHWPIGVGKTLS